MILAPPAYGSKVFGRRKSRPLKAETQKLYETLLPQVIFDPLNFNWQEKRSCMLEIGFGGGEHLAYQAMQNPYIMYIGAEPFVNGIASLLKLIEKHQIKNIKIWPDDIHLLFQHLPYDGIFDHVYLLYADPWPKKRHHNRRFIQDKRLTLIHGYLKPHGKWMIATDHAPYREWIIDHFKRHQHLFIQDNADIFERPNPQNWPVTRYEEKGQREGRPSAYFIFRKIQPCVTSNQITV